MKKLPVLNLSIRWKIFGAFLIAGFTPLALVKLKLEWNLILLCALALSLTLAWYSGFRILVTISGLKRLAKKFSPQALSPLRNKHSNDELANLIYSFGHFIKGVPTESPKTVSNDYLPKTKLITEGRHVFKAGLSTGDCICADAILLPPRLTEDLILTSRLSGTEGFKLFEECLGKVKNQFQLIINAPDLNEQQRAILEFQALLLEDASLVEGVHQYLQQGLSLTESLNTTFAIFISQLETSDNPYIKTRVADCMDLKQRLLETIVRGNQPATTHLYAQTKDKIVLCENIFPSDVIALAKAGAKGIISIKGTASSHASILLDSFNLPSLSNIDDLPIHLMADKNLLLDTLNRELILNPTPKDKHLKLAPITLSQTESITEHIHLSSGEPLLVGATLNNVYTEAQKALFNGADGVGLFRTEMTYMGRGTLPTEEELMVEYRLLFETFNNKPVVIRLLDLGSDKLAAFQEKEVEENPCMGNRSTRLLIKRPDILRPQLRAILKTAHAQTSILFPLVSSWHEVTIINEITQHVREELIQEGFDIPPSLRFGLMIEVPGLVERLKDYTPQFSIFNIGSNDLTQYTLAADRNNREVRDYYRFTHPAVLSMIARICEQTAQADVFLCGEMAAIESLWPLVLGLGIRKLSLPYRLIPQAKHQLKQFDLKTCQVLAQKALACKSATEVEWLLGVQKNCL